MLKKSRVSGYAVDCMSEKSAIVSLKEDDIRRVTIETSLKTGQIVQVKGAYNKQPTNPEIRVIALWAQQFGLKV